MQFFLTLLPAGFKASLEAGSLTSKLAGIHADLQNIAPANTKYGDISKRTYGGNGIETIMMEFVLKWKTCNRRVI